MSIVVPAVGSSSLLSRMTSTAWSLKAWSVAGSPRRGGGPGSKGMPFVPPSGRPKDSTWPQCGPIACWTPLTTGMPFWEIMCSSWSGCHRFGSVMIVPAFATMSGGFTAL